MKSFLCMFAFTMLLAGCGEEQQEAGNLERNTSVQMEKTVLEEEGMSTDWEEVVDAVHSESTASQDQKDFSDTERNLQGTEMMENEEDAEMKLRIEIGDSSFLAALEKNTAVEALMERMEKEPLVLQMADYGGFEKVGELGQTLPSDNSQMTAQPGDIMLYQGNQLVLFYETHTWSYTKLGQVEDLSGWAEALGDEEVTVTFSLEG